MASSQRDDPAGDGAVASDSPKWCYGGIRRLTYVGALFLFAMLFESLREAGAGGPPGSWGTIAANFSMLLVLMIPTYHRVQNTGLPGWWCLTLPIPLVNIYLLLHCLLCQEGYADSKGLDLAGVLWLLVGLPLVAILLLLGGGR